MMRKRKTNQANLFNQKATKKEVKMTKEISANKGHTEPVEVRQLIDKIYTMSQELKYSKSGIFKKSKK